MLTIGYFSLISLFSHIFFIYVTWIAIQSVNFEVFIRKNHVREARLLIILLTIVIGSTVSNFVLDIIRWSQDLVYLFS
ncbi:MAG: DUF1146 domain-containing protein [Bacilli bacterium]|nr:DUF1146 domain-containing protein [Bacilli bacterium]